MVQSFAYGQSECESDFAVDFSRKDRAEFLRGFQFPHLAKRLHVKFKLDVPGAQSEDKAASSRKQHLLPSEAWRLPASPASVKR